MTDTINLLPKQFNKTARRQFQLSLAVLIVGIAVAGTLGTTAYYLINKPILAKIIRDEEATKKNLEQELKQTTDLQLQLSYILDRKSSFESLESESKDFGLLLDKIAAATPQAIRLASVTLNSNGEISLSGIAHSRNDITTFTDRLRQLAVADQIILNQANSQEAGVQFTVTMEPEAKKASSSAQDNKSEGAS